MNSGTALKTAANCLSSCFLIELSLTLEHTQYVRDINLHIKCVFVLTWVQECGKDTQTTWLTMTRFHLNFGNLLHCFPETKLEKHERFERDPVLLARPRWPTYPWACACHRPLRWFWWSILNVSLFAWIHVFVCVGFFPPAVTPYFLSLQLFCLLELFAMQCEMCFPPLNGKKSP